MAVVAIVAGADVESGGRLGLAMIALQVSIGSLNDIVDADRDAGHKPGKPIPAGLVSPRLAWAVVIGAGAAGVALSLPSGTIVGLLAIVVLAIGYAYDLVFKATIWSWVPFAIGIPVLPVFGWLGASGSLPGAFAVLLPAAVLSGAALAIANARADTERDAAAGTESIATRLGSEVAWAVHAVLLAVVVVSAVLTLAIWGATAGTFALVLGMGGVVAAGVVLGREGDAVRRERAWEVEAVGVGLLAAAWLAGSGLGG